MRPISKDDLQVGDILFFRISGKMSHVGLYVGRNQFVHAPCDWQSRYGWIFELTLLPRRIHQGRATKLTTQTESSLLLMNCCNWPASDLQALV